MALRVSITKQPPTLQQRDFLEASYLSSLDRRLPLLQVEVGWDGDDGLTDRACIGSQRRLHTHHAARHRLSHAAQGAVHRTGRTSTTCVQDAPQPRREHEASRSGGTRCALCWPSPRSQTACPPGKDQASHAQHPKVTPPRGQSTPAPNMIHRACARSSRWRRICADASSVVMLNEQPGSSLSLLRSAAPSGPSITP